jgi:hypothetical protein
MAVRIEWWKIVKYVMGEKGEQDPKQPPSLKEAVLAPVLKIEKIGTLSNI